MTLKQKIAATFKQNLNPAITLQLVALGLMLGYWNLAFVQDQLSELAAVKRTYGIWYSAIATAVFGALIPGLYKLYKTPALIYPYRKLLFLMIVWAAIGCFVDFLYQLQGVWFGHGTDWQTIALKTAVDQFLVSALISCPLITICYLWHDNHFNFKATKRQLGKTLFMVHIPATVATNWLIWIPAVAIIYSMPADLQLPFFNLVLCFFSLLIAGMDRKGD